MAPMSGSREWDAPEYDALAAPMTRRGVAILDHLELTGDEVVMDAGCGTGRVTRELLRRLPRGRVVAVDGSAAMVEAAQTLLGRDPRASFVHADLVRDLGQAPGSLDAVVSTSTLHWIADHDRLFANLAEVLRPGGQLVVDCGGAGNIADIVAILEELGESGAAWHFAEPGETGVRLRAAGFDVTRIWLSDDPHDVSSRAELRRYLTTVVLGAHLAGREPAAGRALVAAVASRMSDLRVGYVRLNIIARRSEEGS